MIGTPFIVIALLTTGLLPRCWSSVVQSPLPSETVSPTLWASPHATDAEHPDVIIAPNQSRVQAGVGQPWCSPQDVCHAVALVKDQA